MAKIKMASIILNWRLIIMIKWNNLLVALAVNHKRKVRARFVVTILYCYSLEGELAVDTEALGRLLGSECIK